MAIVSTYYPLGDAKNNFDDDFKIASEYLLLTPYTLVLFTDSDRMSEAVQEFRRSKGFDEKNTVVTVKPLNEKLPYYPQFERANALPQYVSNILPFLWEDIPRDEKTNFVIWSDFLIKNRTHPYDFVFFERVFNERKAYFINYGLQKKSYDTYSLSELSEIPDKNRYVLSEFLSFSDPFGDDAKRFIQSWQEAIGKGVDQDLFLFSWKNLYYIAKDYAQALYFSSLDSEVLNYFVESDERNLEMNRLEFGREQKYYPTVERKLGPLLLERFGINPFAGLNDMKPYQAPAYGKEVTDAVLEFFNLPKEEQEPFYKRCAKNARVIFSALKVLLYEHNKSFSSLYN